MTDEMKWPKGFADIGGRTFKWTVENRPEWCEFTKQMRDVTGFFKIWRTYLLKDAEEDSSKL